MNTISLDTEQKSAEFVPEKSASLLIASSSSSDAVTESEIILLRTIRSYGLFLCTFLFADNWFRIGIYLFPSFFPGLIVNSPNFCLIQSYLLHVLTLFHLNITISIHLFWHYCFIFSKYWQNLTYLRLLTYFLCIFFLLCLFTWPTTSNEWASIKFDGILKICIVDYTFHLSYTFFLLSLTCLIPYLALILSHNVQMKSIQRRIGKYFSTSSTERSNILDRKNQFQHASSVILIWSLINIILLICIHIPIENDRLIKSIVFYIQMFALIFEPILYIFTFRSLSIITLLRPSNEIYL